MKNINATKRNIAAVAVAAVGSFSLLSAPALQADVLAVSVLQINNLTFSKTGGATLDVSDFGGGITYTSTGDVSAQLGATTVTDNDLTVGAATIDLAPACVGTCPAIVDNNFDILSAGTGDPSSQFSAADQYQAGSPITGIGAPVGATIEAASYVSLTSKGDGSSTGNNNLNSSWVFGGFAGSLDVDFSATAYIEAFVSADSISPSFATASFNVVFSLVDLSLGGAPVDTWNVGSTAPSADEPFNLNDTRSANSPFANGLPLFAGAALGVANTGAFHFTTQHLFADHVYQLSARVNTNADATMIPEPGVIALLGAGLLGLGFSRKRRNA